MPPWAAQIASNLPRARPSSSTAAAAATPAPLGALSTISSRAPAKSSARRRRSAGAVASPRRTASTSCASSAGPIPRPTGWLPSVCTQRTRSPIALPTSLRRRESVVAASALRTLAVGPTGKSRRTCSEPAAAFLDSTDATNWPSLSMSRGRSTRMRMSSAGLNRIEPPHAMQAPSFSTTVRMASRVRSTGASISIVSAVPGGDVIARDDFFGITRPRAAMIGTTSSVVRLPGRPPTQCLSTMGDPGHLRRVPTSIIARLRAMVSCRSIRSPAPAALNAARCKSEYRPAATSATMRRIAASPRLATTSAPSLSRVAPRRRCRSGMPRGAHRAAACARIGAHWRSRSVPWP